MNISSCTSISHQHVKAARAVGIFQVYQVMTAVIAIVAKRLTFQAQLEGSVCFSVDLGRAQYIHSTGLLLSDLVSLPCI